MNIIELEEILKKNNIIVSNRIIAKIWGMDEAAYSRKKKVGSEIKQKNIEQIEDEYGICITSNQIKLDCVRLDFYPDVFGSCGSGSMVFSETKEKLAVTKDIITNYSTSNQYSIISARGSSMSPVINDDDKLVIQHNLNEQIIDDTVYLFRYNDELFIKRLVKNVDQIVCISENPRFQDRIIEPKGDNFSIIGKVVGLFRSKV
jgi:phage repressor protein C with HTH and peptisase S24 domain